MDHADISEPLVGAVGKAGARELLDALIRPETDRAALVGRLSRCADGEWLGRGAGRSRSRWDCAAAQPGPVRCTTLRPRPS